MWFTEIWQLPIWLLTRRETSRSSILGFPLWKIMLMTELSISMFWKGPLFQHIHNSKKSLKISTIHIRTSKFWKDWSWCGKGEERKWHLDDLIEQKQIILTDYWLPSELMLCSYWSRSPVSLPESSASCPTFPISTTAIDSLDLTRQAPFST